MVKNYRILAFLLLVLLLETAAASSEVETSDVASPESKPDVIIKLIKRGAAERLSDSSNEAEEMPRDKRRSSSKKNKGRKVGKK